jgi:hypothetical protein
MAMLQLRTVLAESNVQPLDKPVQCQLQADCLEARLVSKTKPNHLDAVSLLLLQT